MIWSSSEIKFHFAFSHNGNKVCTLTVQILTLWFPEIQIKKEFVLYSFNSFLIWISGNQRVNIWTVKVHTLFPLWLNAKWNLISDDDHIIYCGKLSFGLHNDYCSWNRNEKWFQMMPISYIVAKLSFVLHNHPHGWNQMEKWCQNHIDTYGFWGITITG